MRVKATLTGSVIHWEGSLARLATNVAHAQPDLTACADLILLRRFSDAADEAREVLVAHFLRGRTQADLAAEWGASPATISRRVKAAIEALREALAGRGVTVGAALLAAVCAERTAEAAPAALTCELGKMSM